MHPTHLVFIALISTGSIAFAQIGRWDKQPIDRPVPRLWSVSMFDSSRGVACGDSLGSSHGRYMATGLRKEPKNPTWKFVNITGEFIPSTSHQACLNAVSAVPGTGTAFTCGGLYWDHNTSQVMRTDLYGQDWYWVDDGTHRSIDIQGKLRAIHFKSTHEGITAGADGVAYYTSDGGEHWSLIPTGTKKSFYGIHTSASGPYWYLTGDDKTIVRWSPSSAAMVVNPALIPGPASARIEGVSCVNDSTTFFGVGTEVVRSSDNGVTFASLPAITPAPSTIYTIWFFDEQSGWVAGSYTDMYYTSNGGSSWIKHSAAPAGITGNLTRFSFLSPMVGYATGSYADTGQGWILKFTADPDITRSDTLADFGAFVCGNSRDVQVAIINSGGSNLTIAADGITLPAGFTLVAPDLPPFTIPPGSWQAITVRWTPPPNQPDSIAPGTRMRIVCNDADHATWYVNLKGKRNYSKLTATAPAPAAPTCIGSSTPGDIPYTTGGNIDPAFIALEYESGDNDFSLLAPAPGTLVHGPGVIRFKFSPGARGPRTGIYRILSGDPFCPDTQRVSFSGVGLLIAGKIVGSPVDFGETCPTHPVDREFLVINIGDEAEIVDTVAFASGERLFTVISPPLPSQAIAVGDSLRIQVRFLPGMANIGPLTATYNLAVRSVPHGCTALFPVKFEGISTRPNLTIAPVLIDFGELAHCMATKDTIVTIHNAGMFAETVMESRPLATPFSLAATLPLAIGTNDTARVTVRFAPVADGEYRDTLLLVTERCGSIIPVICRGAYYGQAASALPDRLQFTGVNVGASLVKNSTLAVLHATAVRVARIVIDPAGPFVCETPTPLSLDPGRTTPLVFRFTPAARGAVADTALVIMDAPCEDTLRILLEGTGIDQGLVFKPDSLDFGARAQCEAPVMEDTLVNLGASPCTLTGSTVTGSGASYYTVLNPVTANETLAGGGTRVFQVRFAPGTGYDQPEPATLRVTTSDTAQAVLTLPLRGVRSMQRTPADVVEFTGTIPVGQPYRVSAMLTNLNYRPVTYGSAIGPPEAVVRTSFPKTFWIGNENIVTDITPQQAGPFTYVVTVYVDSTCKDSTKIFIEGVATSGVWSQTSANFDAMPACGSQRKTVTLVNGDGFRKRIYGIAIEGVDSLFFSVISPSPPFYVEANDSALITIGFTPAKATRTYSATCVSYLSDTANARHIESALTASSELMLLTAALPLDAGWGRTGTPVTAMLPVVNGSHFAVTIAQASLSSMTVRSTAPALPATLAPGDTLRVQVEWTPQSEGAATDSLVVQITAPCDGRAAFIAEGRGLPLDVMATALSVPVLEGRVDDHVLIPVTSSADLGAAGTTSWTGTLRFNRTMLWPLGVVKEGTLSADMNVAMNYDHTTGTATLTGDGAALRAGAGPLVMVEALVLIGNDVMTPVAIDPAFDFTSGRARVVARQNGEFHLVGYCLGEGNRLIRIDGAYALEQNRPNPFNPVTEISYAIAMEGMVRLAVYDAWGRDVATLVDAPQAAGRHTARFDARALPSGVYYYRLVSGRFMETRKMVVSK